MTTKETADIVGWQPIETFDESVGGQIVLWGRRYGWEDTQEEIDQQEPEVLLLGGTYEHGGKRIYASTETYWGSETYYVQPTHWMRLPPLPTPPVDGENRGS
jgi:hypothetical protein